MEHHTEPAPTAAVRIPSEKESATCKGVQTLVLIAEQSSLSPRDFWKALTRIASNDAAMLASLNNGSWTYGKDNPKEAQKPIEIE